MSEVVPGPSDAKRYIDRRAALLSSMSADAVALVPSARMVIRNRDTEYAFRQDSDFFYLTGFTEPNAVLVLDSRDGTTKLFCQDRDANLEQWTGRRLGAERAAQVLGVDSADVIDTFADELETLIDGCHRLYVTMGEHPEFDQVVIDAVATVRRREAGGRIAPSEVVSLKGLLHEQRLIKSDVEIELMRRAADISSAGHERAMRACRAGMTEADLEAELVYEFMRSGARFPAYTSIVGSGANGCILHYVENESALVDGELVLIDAGCEYQHYAADITRTFPVSGRFEGPQREVYEVVLDAQRAAIAAAVPGAPFIAPHETAARRLTEGLIALGVLEGDAEEVLDANAQQPYTVHRASHWLGIDVHDVGSYRDPAGESEWRVFEPGMVLTVEPGLYFPSHILADSPYTNIGIRIEDDVLITNDGNEVITSPVKEIAAIEELMSG